MLSFWYRRNISPASFDKGHNGRGSPHGVQHHLPFRHHPSTSTSSAGSSSVFPSFELPLGTIPEKMNFAALPPPPPPLSGTVVAPHVQPSQLQVATATTAPVNFDHHLAPAVSAAYPHQLHQHYQFEVLYVMLLMMGNSLP